MAAAISGGVPLKLEKKPVKFSNLLCESATGATYICMMLKLLLVGAGLNMFE